MFSNDTCKGIVLNKLCLHEKLIGKKIYSQEFDEKESKNFEGQLCKYTNVVKGWQYRWFVINSIGGMLEYYTVKKI